MNREDVARVRQINIAVVIGRDVELAMDKRDQRIGACPFCGTLPTVFRAEAGLMLSQRLGLYHCFSCKVGGDVIDYMMRSQKMTAEEACSWLEAEFVDTEAEVIQLQPRGGAA